MKTPAQRRFILIERMDQLERQGIGCGACTGQCCTSRSNSMLITSQEAQDIVDHLVGEKLWSSELEKRLRDNINEYRLDVEIPSHGARRNFRRTYTCPFYNAGPRGCMLPREVKPYGCLGFNPLIPLAKGLEDGCRSDQGLLADRENTDEFGFLELKNAKVPIPLAVLQASKN